MDDRPTHNPPAGAYPGGVQDKAIGSRFAWGGREWTVCGVRRGKVVDGVRAGQGVWAYPEQEAAMTFFPVTAKQAEQVRKDTSQMKLPKREDKEVGFQLLNEGRHRARAADYEIRPSKWKGKPDSMQITFKVPQEEGEPQEVRGFWDWDMNVKNPRSFGFFVMAMTGQEFPDDDDLEDLEMDDLMKPCWVTIKHNTKKVANKEGEQVDRTFANVIKVERIEKKAKEAVKPKQPEPEVDPDDTSDFYEE